MADRDVAALVAAVARAVGRSAGVRTAYVFGSRVTGRARPDSDLDVAVLYDRGLDGRARELVRRDIVAALTDELGAVGERADVVDLHAAGSSLAFAVVRDGHLAVDRDPAARVACAALTFRKYDDEAPRRAMFRDAVRRAAKHRAAGAT